MLTTGVLGLDKLKRIFRRVDSLHEVEPFLLDNVSYTFTMSSFSRYTRPLNRVGVVVDVDIAIGT
jgi:hypothetical protein